MARRADGTPARYWKADGKPRARKTRAPMTEMEVDLRLLVACAQQQGRFLSAMKNGKVPKAAYIEQQTLTALKIAKFLVDWDTNTKPV